MESVVYSTWIKNGIHKPGKSAVGLAKAITKALRISPPMHRITIYKMISGKRSVYSEELGPIASYIEEPVPNLNQAQPVVNVPIIGTVHAGAWTEGDSESGLDSIPVHHDIDHPNAKMFAYRVSGDSMASVGIIDGDVIVCIPPNGIELSDGKQVVIKRTRAGLVEYSARRSTRSRIVQNITVPTIATNRLLFPRKITETKSLKWWVS